MGPSASGGDAVVVAGALAQRAKYGGHAWVFLNYLIGFRRLGFDVLFLDRLEPDMAIDDVTAYANVRDILEPFGLGDNFAILCRGQQNLGLSREAVLETARRSVLLLNVMGFLDDQEILRAAPLRAFLDIDPGFGQMWHELGQVDVMAGHDRFVTIGENIGEPACTVPTCGLDWITTRQPIVLDQWPATDGNGPFTSVGAWRGDFAPVIYDGRTYGLRVHEFRRFAAVPHITGKRFEVAFDIHPDETSDLELLKTNGWSLVNPADATSNPSAYRSFIQRSGAEFAAVKGMYVHTRSGWVSDRSACYLASAKPVVVQDTGLDGLYPLGEGLITFTTLDEAAAGVEEVARNRPRHAAAAREIAETYFDSDKVLSSLLRKLAA